MNDRLPYVIRAVVYLLCGVVGFVVAWSIWHLYIDHQSLHQIIGLINQTQAGPPHPK